MNKPSSREKRELQETVDFIERKIQSMTKHFLKGDVAVSRAICFSIEQHAKIIDRDLKKVERRLKLTNNETKLLFGKKVKGEKDDEHRSGAR